ncbi:cytochrome C oxidase subunit IV family protein [Acidobacteria bacterium AH-259-D05]|nr:cytochrome C oxidase subunit IV family protein [Acidobacteria bacterium AH-259-D05]
MARDQLKSHSRPYWRIWFVLLLLTMGMVFIDQSPMARGALVLILVTAMLGKATLIAAYFMHLRFERVSLVLTVAVGLLITGLLLFVLIAPDGVRALSLAPQ